MSHDFERREAIRQRYQEESEAKKLYIPAREKESITASSRPMRVCAYCRVSTDNDEQLSSFELQQAHYRSVAQSHPNWNLLHIYADEGISGTSLKKRDEFNEMIAACEMGEYDLIVTKSVSRFARNLVDCVSLVRKLKNLTPPVGVLFETDNLYTLSENSELMLSFLATFAQEESVKKSESMVWSLTQRFKRGKLLTPSLLGYDRDENGKLVVNDAEANTVRFIYDAFLSGMGIKQIASLLSDVNCQTKTGSTNWSEGSITYILKNERYCGNVMTWKTFTSDIFEHKTRKNNRDREQYLYLDDHEAIVSSEKFDAVQTLFENRKHHVRGGLPMMHVIDDGMFSGFIPINHHWINDDPNSYYEASKKARSTRTVQRLRRDTFSVFDLRGYQVVRSHFLSKRNGIPTLTITNNQITFNTECVRKFHDVPYVQMLLHPTERKIAIRPCEANDVHCIRWRPKKERPLMQKTIRCESFASALFQIMDWDPEYAYQIRGVWASNNRNEIISFLLNESVAVIKIDTERIETFPQEWEDNFGLEFYDHNIKNNLHLQGADAKSRPLKESDVINQTELIEQFKGGINGL